MGTTMRAVVYKNLLKSNLVQIALREYKGGMLSLLGRSRGTGTATTGTTVIVVRPKEEIKDKLAAIVQVRTREYWF